MIGRVVSKKGIQAFFRLPGSVRKFVLQYYVHRLTGFHSSDSATIWTSFFYYTLEQEVVVTELVDFYEVKFIYQYRPLCVLLRKGESSDVFVFFQVFIRNEYDALFERIRNRKQLMRFCLDAGANIGLFSIALCAQVADVHVTAVEPEEGNFKLLQKNLALNGLEGRVHPEQAALWVKNEIVFLTSGAQQEWSFRVGGEPRGALPTPGWSLNDILAVQKWSACDLVKMDVEGAEDVLFRDDAFLRALEHIPLLAMEIHDQWANRASIHAELLRSGYTFFEVGELTVAEKYPPV